MLLGVSYMLAFPDGHIRDDPFNRIFSLVTILAIEISPELVVFALIVHNSVLVSKDVKRTRLLAFSRS